MKLTNKVKVNNIFLKTDTNTYEYDILNQADSVALIVKTDTEITTETFNIFFSFNPNVQLQHNDAWKLSINTNDVVVKKFGTIEFDVDDKLNLTYELKNNSLAISIKKPINSSDFTFCPSITKNDAEFTLIKEYITPKYIETWFVIDESNNIYINDVFKNRHVHNWKKSSFKNQETMPVGVIKEESVEEAIIAMCIAEDKGCYGFDLHLNFLFKKGLLCKENITKICQSSTLPILALNYNPEISQAQRLEGLELAIEAGCAAIDFQGFMFCDEKTNTTHTIENRNYYKYLGFDMSFLDSSPQETVVNPVMVNKQMEYVNKIHAMGGEVLISTHIQTVLNKRQLISYAKFHAAHGFDILKIVALGKTSQDVIECVEACKELRNDPDLKNVKVTLHLSGEKCVYITRLLCPAFYGSYITFCYPELTKWQDPNQLDLDVAVNTIKAKTENNQNITIDEGVKILKTLCDHPQFNTIIKDYEDSL